MVFNQRPKEDNPRRLLPLEDHMSTEDLQEFRSQGKMGSRPSSPRFGFYPFIFVDCLKGLIWKDEGNLKFFLAQDSIMSKYQALLNNCLFLLNQLLIPKFIIHHALY